MKSDEEWPTSEVITNEEEIMKEKRKNIISTLANITAEKWYLIYFSSYFKIVRMISWILRFINNCRHGGRNYGKTLSVEELNIAEKKLVKIVQQEAFSSEEQLKGHFTFRDEEGIIRLKTKILRRHDDENFRCPIVLPSKHELVERMIQDYHLQLLHAGTQVLLTNIRQKFWIIKGRKTVQGVISKCVRCKRHSAKALDTVPCPLPEDRVRDAYAFEVTELIESLSTNGFFLGFRRFIARKGRPIVVYSDNGTNFVGARNLLSDLLTGTKLSEVLRQMKIQVEVKSTNLQHGGAAGGETGSDDQEIIEKSPGKSITFI
ncbi:uncharacterized protein LOC118185989 [Stegodyphus dumicola]|uniref:uncharacterized protein LOC118185989 n=1 Tax=Stegodyphus dumicola TaxID=202533 RepID=UPI0015A82166|nr:uncharacterized protein LOC118185989 [Stegodyphus dumicola]